MEEYGALFVPLVNLFEKAQITALLMAWLPVKLEAQLSGIMAVDMFITCALATGLTGLLGALFVFGCKLFSDKSTDTSKDITIRVEHYTTGKWGYQYTSEFYEALSWAISSQTQDLKEGSFVVEKPSATGEKGEDDCAPPDFNVLPEKDQKVIIDYGGRKFEVTFFEPEENNEDGSSRRKKKSPSIFLKTVEKDESPNVRSVSEFVAAVTRAHLEYLKSKKVRSRYERNEGSWDRIQALIASKGLETVAMDEPQEALIRKELSAFIKDKGFYTKIGMPYRRGILLYGKPGTGKTSLINAISAELKRDLYFISLRDFKENADSELSATFSSVPANQIIVLEDVDTQSSVLHKRTERKLSSLFDMSAPGPSVGLGFGPTFSLSTFLGCLDGHILAEGQIIIMSSNHPEVLDPAVIRPGRMDVQLELGYCTHYQINRMYQTVTENSDLTIPQEALDQIPEGLLSPCEVMTSMVLYRTEPEVIPEKLLDLVKKRHELNEKERLEKATREKEESEKEKSEKKEGEKINQGEEVEKAKQEESKKEGEKINQDEEVEKAKQEESKDQSVDEVEKVTVAKESSVNGSEDETVTATTTTTTASPSEEEEKEKKEDQELTDDKNPLQTAAATTTTTTTDESIVDDAQSDSGSSTDVDEVAVAAAGIGEKTIMIETSTTQEVVDVGSN